MKRFGRTMAELNRMFAPESNGSIVTEGMMAGETADMGALVGDEPGGLWARREELIPTAPEDIRDQITADLEEARRLSEQYQAEIGEKNAEDTRRARQLRHGRGMG